MDIEGIEFNPLHAALALVGGIIALVVAKQSPVGLIIKLGTFLITTVVCYFMISFISNK